MISLNYRDSRPIYEQIKEGLKRLIVTGAIAPDERLPSVRTLASDLSINPNTIQRALSALEGEGYIYSIHGRGSFVSGTVEGGEIRRKELLDQFRSLAAELRFLGVPADELTAIVRADPAGHDGGDTGKRQEKEEAQ